MEVEERKEGSALENPRQTLVLNLFLLENSRPDNMNATKAVQRYFSKNIFVALLRDGWMHG